MYKITVKIIKPDVLPKPSLFSNHGDVAPYPSQGCASFPEIFTVLN